MRTAAAGGRAASSRGGEEGESALKRLEEESPWNVTEYISKRTRRETGPLGQLPEEDLVDLVDLPGWTEENQMRMVVGIIAKEAGVEPEIVARQIDKLRALLPDMADRFESMPTGHLARMALGADGVAIKLITLRDLFPLANISRMVSLRPTLLNLSTEQLETAAAKVREVLVEKEEPYVDRLVEAHPMYLEVNLDRCASEVELLFGKPAWETFRGNPGVLLSVQRAGDMIEQHVDEFQSGLRPKGYQDWA